ncbi:MAG: flavin reductase family protein [Rhodobacterales bacterium]|nr:flavin reductase family protein [Rhodobacterales bacterium]MDX5501235.1 flavin reductase family protein [Rhodobacterales bacterium]
MSQTFVPDADPRAFRNALGRFATGVALVTVAGPQGPVGFLVNSFASVSMDPPLVLWSPARTSSRFGHFENAQHYAIHILAQTHDDWMPRFARDGAGFEGLPHEVNPEGVPVIASALARFDCKRHAAHDGGDHLIIVGRVLRAAMTEGAPLVFSQGRYGQFTGR